MTENINSAEFLDRITSVVPSERQIELQRMGYYNFIHREWRNGYAQKAVEY